VGFAGHTITNNYWLDARPLVRRGNALRTIEVPMEHAEKTLEPRQSLEQQWRIFDSTLSSLVDFVHTFDREGRCLYANKPLLDL
jgi:hypothetical protein